MDTNPETATKLAEELRQLIENTALHDECKVTISFGIAELSEGEINQDWIKPVDAALYEVKLTGSNRVCVSA